MQEQRQLLGVKANATPEELKAAAQQRLAEAKEAYQALKDPTRRAAYDENGDGAYYRILGLANRASEGQIRQAAEMTVERIKAAYQTLKDAPPEAPPPPAPQTEAAPPSAARDHIPLEELPPEDMNPYEVPHSNLGSGYDDREVADAPLWSSQGRMGRVRYIAYSFLIGLFFQVPMFFIGALADSQNGILLLFAGLLLLVAVVAGLYLGIMLGIKRLHDFNASGWLILLLIIPFVSAIFVFFLWLTPGTQGRNQYGPPGLPYKRWEAALAALMLIFLAIFILMLIFGAASLVDGGFPL